MGIQDRKKLITSLEKRLDSRILTLVLGDRQNLETRIAPDILPLLSEHLSYIGSTEQLTLFLYTLGGDSVAGWSIVNLIRQYCKKFKVMVPFRALSCGTLISLGADEVLVGKHGLLSPIDPSVASPFNPQAPGGERGAGPVTLLPVSVEDMIGFLNLARNEVGLKAEQSMVEVLKILADKIHPLALGAVYRAREHNSALAKRLLKMHMEDDGKIDRMVNYLTQQLPTHSYLIGRKEASKDVGLDVSEPPSDVEDLMWQLYKEYEVWLKLTTPASSDIDLNGQDHKQVRYERAAIESMNDKELLQHIFVTDKELVKVKATLPGMQSPIDQVVERIFYQGWIRGSKEEVHS